MLSMMVSLMFVGLLPDERQLVREARSNLAEALAANVTALIALTDDAQGEAWLPHLHGGNFLRLAAPVPASTSPQETRLLDATGVGVGAIVGGGVLALAGVAFATTGPSAIAAFALNGGIAILTALSLAELASRFPQSGGTYAYARRVLTVEAAFAVGWVVWFASVVAAVLYAIGFAAFLVPVGLWAARALGPHVLLVLLAAPLAVALQASGCSPLTATRLLERGQELDYPELQWVQQVNLGNICVELGDPAGALAWFEAALAIARCDVALLRQHPDLQKVDRFRLRVVVLRVCDPGAGRHDLHLARMDDMLVAHAVAVAQCAGMRDGDDLHVVVWMRAEAGARLDHVRFEFLDMSELDLSNASLRESIFRGANLTKAILRRADLSRANLESAILDRADLSGASLVAAQARRIASLERTVEQLDDRLTHDPFLSASLHEVLSTVTAIRSIEDPKHSGSKQVCSKLEKNGSKDARYTKPPALVNGAWKISCSAGMPVRSANGSITSKASNSPPNSTSV